MRRLILLPLCLIALPAPAQEVGPAKGALVVVGGALSDPLIVQRFIELAGGPEAPIVVIPTAGEADHYDRSYRRLDLFRDQGAHDLTVVHTRDRSEADTEAFVRPILAAGGVWQALQGVLERGGVIGGSSAGATIQGSYLVRGDTRTNTIMMGDHEVGFGFLANTAIDQHLLKRNRQFDLIEVIEARPELLGIGIDENTAIVVRGDRFDVIGQSFVAIYDAERMIGDHGRFFLLASGDSYDLVGRKVIAEEERTEYADRAEARPWPR
jgi:cyanophycinase